MSLTERQRHLVEAAQDRLLGDAADVFPCCATCVHVEDNRVMEDDGWGTFMDTEYGYCQQYDCVVAFSHYPCEAWEEA